MDGTGTKAFLWMYDEVPSVHKQSALKNAVARMEVYIVYYGGDPSMTLNTLQTYPNVALLQKLKARIGIATPEWKQFMNYLSVLEHARPRSVATPEE